MNEADLRRHLLIQLENIVARLPNGLLHRLVLDARFFNEVNIGKRQARAMARYAQKQARSRRSG